MSAGHPEGAHAHAHADAQSHDGHGHGGAPHGTYRDYMTGFVLAVILTVIPFFMVMARPIESAGYTAAIVLICALAQILVHMIYFLHMTPKAEDGWLLLSTMFTIVLVVIALAGSLWIVFHLNRNMMPGAQSGHEMPPVEAPASQ
jgi:cytochrome o ubiquinol oxidase operon protein cyoD